MEFLERRTDPNKARARSPEHYHCNPIMDSLRPDRSGSSFCHWIPLVALCPYLMHRITL